MAAPATLGNLNQVFGSVISKALTLVGILAVIMIVVGGYKYLMAGSDKDGASKARNTLTYVFLGLVLAVSAWMIISLVGRFLGVNLSTFNICFGGSTC
jgi:hypothetical protein